MKTQSNNTKNNKEKTKEVYEITWRKIPITITYMYHYFASAGVSHLTVKADQPIPITETGYRSIWVFDGELDERSPVEYVIEALDGMSRLKKWQDYLKQKQTEELKKKQLSLF